MERDLPERKAVTHQAEKVHLDPTSDLYHRAYQSWRVGELDDKGVVNIFGDEWLFLFQVNKEGLEGETLDSADIQKPVEHAEDVVTQLDSDLVGQGSMTEYAGAGHGVWGHELRTEVGPKPFQLTHSEEDVVREG